jgi:hypothetical protein
MSSLPNKTSTACQGGLTVKGETVTKQEKRQLMSDLQTLRHLICRTEDFQHIWLNYPVKPCTTPLTLITRSVRLCRGGIKPL